VVLLAQLSEALGSALAAGDFDGAHVVNEAIGRLLGPAVAELPSASSGTSTLASGPRPNGGHVDSAEQLEASTGEGAAVVHLDARRRGKGGRS
jgi:hypothetical protein